MRKSKRLKLSSSKDNNNKEKALSKRAKNLVANDGSSSESDIENYLHPINKLDLNSSFFNPVKSKNEDSTSFDQIEKKLFDGITRLSDSDEESENEEINKKSINGNKTNEPQPSTSKAFDHLTNFNKKLEEAKTNIEMYNNKNKIQEETNIDVSKLLALGEINVKQQTTCRIEKNDDNLSLHSSDFESEKEDWEEIKSGEENKVIPKEGIQITVDMPNVIKKKKGQDLEAAMKRRLNRIKKEKQVLIHKVHLLCWLGHGFYVNKILNCEKILALSLSLLPSEKSYPNGKIDLKYLEQFLNWYTKYMKIIKKDEPKELNLEKMLQLQINRKEVYNEKMLVYIFISILRSLGIQCRLILSFQVEPLRPPDLLSLSNKDDKIQQNKQVVQTENTIKNEKKINNENGNNKILKENNQKKKIKTEKINNDNINREKSNNNSKTIKNKKAVSSNVKRKPSETIETRSKSLTDDKSNKKKDLKIKLTNLVKTKGKKTVTIPQVDGNLDNSDDEVFYDEKEETKLKECYVKITPLTKDLLDNIDNKISQIDGSDDKKTKKTNLTNLKTNNKVSTSKINDIEDVSSKKSNRNQSKFFKNTKKLDVRNDVVHLVKKRIKEERQKEESKLIRNKRKKRKNSSSSDSDFVPENMISNNKKHESDSDDEFVPKTKVKKRVQIKSKNIRKVISSDKSDSETDNKIINKGKVKEKKIGIDVWAEVFVELEEKWISVDVPNKKIHCVNELYKRASHPVSYIVAWNNDNTIKDVTKRYCQNFNTITRKLRVDSKWWDEALFPFLGPKTAQDREEDDEIERYQLEKPLPTSIAEFKNHPLYILKRHLLKFEGIYPSDAPPVGFVKGEPVYSRANHYVLRSREIWLKEAKVVKPGEEPYKIVKARPKYDKLSNTMITDQMLELFGQWQTMDYEPPVAENGIVPRNAFGNVELFKPCMLPKKTVHLQLPGLNKIARKMGIDCASAIVGFDFHGGWSHPVYDGFVVCEEFEKELVNAWNIEQEELEKKEQEKLNKRVYGNWKKLTRGLLIRERLKAKYDFGKNNCEKKIIKKKRCIESDSD